MARTSSKLKFPLSVSQIYSNALWDPKPTTSQLSEKQLAYALGYPSDWRVERKVIATEDGKRVISDRIHLSTTKRQFTWLHHDAAQAAAQQAAQDGNIDASHLMPPVPLYAKGDEIQVQYESVEVFNQDRVVRVTKHAGQLTQILFGTAKLADVLGQGRDPRHRNWIPHFLYREGKIEILRRIHGGIRPPFPRSQPLESRGARSQEWGQIR